MTGVVPAHGVENTILERAASFASLQYHSQLAVVSATMSSHPFVFAPWFFAGAAQAPISPLVDRHPNGRKPVAGFRGAPGTGRNRARAEGNDQSGGKEDHAVVLGTM